MILFLISLLAGALTVLAPCTISLLPIIVGGSLAGDTSIRRTIVVTISLGISVILFTLLLKVSTTFINVPQSFWQIISGIIIIFLGLTMIFPVIWEKLPFVNKLNQGSNKIMSSGYMKQSLIGDILVGASLGPVFSSCSPTYFLIIATVLPRSILAGFVYLLAYSFGLCVALLIVAIAGQKLLERIGVASDPRGIFKRVIGVLFIFVGGAIALGLDARIELAFANSALFSHISGIEQNLLSNSGPILPTSTSTSLAAPGASFAVSSTPTIGSTATSSDGRIAAKSLVYPRSPEIAGPSGFINTDGQPITIASLKGKVVLIDFWDYTCINCQREIPYVEAWYKKYQPEGLVIVGVHTPEFAFEKLQSNLQAAVTSLGITYPVVIDNNYSTWNAFSNEYWPQIYLVDSDGFIVYSHSGEGDYPQTEAAIQKALIERDANQGLSNTVSKGAVNPSGTTEVGAGLGSPETYFGYNRNQYLANGTKNESGNQNLTVPNTLTSNALYLGGLWNFSSEYTETADTKNGKIEYTFTAKNVYMVAVGNPSATVKVLLDGQPVGSNAGADVSADGTMAINVDKLYKLISLPDYGTHTLEIDLESGTLDAYTFTFG
jgi:cytochrome c biogenesis protein CcdA/thiol-disulfide isomerase/thioredoxin